MNITPTGGIELRFKGFRISEKRMSPLKTEKHVSIDETKSVQEAEKRWQNFFFPEIRNRQCFEENGSCSVN